jgi:3,4-dihydroxy 2-butanone 4-phosphate synthase/GTP cyclohydrolase II
LHTFIKEAVILADFLASIKTPDPQHKRRPKVTLSYAQSLDGSIAMSRGAPYSLSGLESQVLTHKLRATHDAILVGINTVISDNPYLTVRLVEGASPLPIVLDSSLRLPLNSNLLKGKVPPLIAAVTSASREKQEQIEESGAKIIRLDPDERGWVDLHSLLNTLSDLGIHNLMVEGGARVITSFLSRHLVDCVVITIAPTFLGGLHALENPLVPCSRAGITLDGLPEFTNSGYEQVGKDIIFWSALTWAKQ